MQLKSRFLKIAIVLLSFALLRLWSLKHQDLAKSESMG